MAKKDDPEVNTRVLSLTVPGGQFAMAGESSAQNGAISAWEKATVAGFTMITSRESIDLSGYSLQDKTVFFQACINQEVGVVGGFSAAGGIIQVLNLVTTTPVSLADLSSLQSDGYGWLLPGSSQSTFNLDNVIQGKLRQYEQLSTTSFLSQTNMASWGSGDSTAGDKLYLTTALLWPTTINGNIFIPDQAYVLPIIIAEEPELEYMMRLTRSLEPVY